MKIVVFGARGMLGTDLVSECGAMGVAVDLFTPLFAISRIAGWTTHVIEERFGEAAAKPALYRPKSAYIGDYCGPDECAYVPMENR